MIWGAAQYSALLTHVHEENDVRFGVESTGLGHYMLLLQQGAIDV